LPPDLAAADDQGQWQEWGQDEPVSAAWSKVAFGVDWSRPISATRRTAIGRIPVLAGRSGESLLSLR